MPMSKKKENEILYEIAIEGNIMKWFQKFMKQYGENACESLMDSFFKEHDSEIRLTKNGIKRSMELRVPERIEILQNTKKYVNF